MKAFNIGNLVSHFALASMLALWTGCGSGNYQKGDHTAAGLTESAGKIGAGKAKIDGALAALNDLVNNPQGDLVAKFKTFDASVNDLQTTAQDVKARVNEMRESGHEYFKAWDEQLALIKNEDIKSRSAARREEVEKRFMGIKRAYTETEIAFQPFMAGLKDIQIALGTDLTAGGLSAIKSAAEKTIKNAEPLKATVDKLQSQFKELGVAMAASAPATPPTTTDAK